MLKRVYVSQQIRDAPEADILKTREICLDLAKGFFPDDEIIEVPKFEMAKVRGLHPARILGMSIELMSDADLVIFAEGWQYARGCRIEHRVCQDYNIPYKEISGWCERR